MSLEEPRMITEHFVMVGLDDIRYVQLRCHNCNGYVSLDPDGFTRLPERCPQCHVVWRDDDQGTSDQQTITNFLTAIQDTRKQQKDTKRLKIKLVFPSNL